MKCIPYYYLRNSKLNYENFPFILCVFHKVFPFRCVFFIFQIYANMYSGYILLIYGLHLCMRCYYIFTCFVLVFHEIEFSCVKYDDDNDGIEFFE